MDANARYRLIAIDLDGTLLAPDGTLSPRNRAALHRAHESGMKVVVCTGRSLAETRPVLASIGLDLDAVVTAGGALISDVRSGATLERAPMTLETAEALLTWFRAAEYTVLWLHDAVEAGFDGYAVAGSNRHPAIDRWLQRSPCRMRCVDDSNGLGTHASGRQSPTWPPLRLTVIDSEEALIEMSDRLEVAFGARVAHNRIHVPAYDFTVLECFGQGVDKWRGISALCERWSIDPKATAAIGDDVNDIPMLTHAGLGVAVKNARKAAKRAAARVVASNADDGVAELVDWLMDAPQAQYHLWLDTHGSK